MWAALYVAIHAETAIGEIVRHVSPDLLATLNYFRLSELDLELQSVWDCRDAAALGLEPDDLVHDYDFGVTQELAAAAIARNAEGILVPSATGLGDNLIVFPDCLRRTSRLEVSSRDPQLYVSRSDMPDNVGVSEKTPSYAAAGVDTDAAERLVSRFADLAKSARRPEVLADIGPFAGLFRLGAYRDPVLVASTDSVGTKVKLAGLLGRYDSVGHDLVNHCVNDILTSGAEPLFFLDYIGNCGLSDDAKAELVKGCVEACRDAGCALLGGETADMPGTYADGDFDLVGFIVGVVERDNIIDGSRIEEGDVLLALRSSGLHTNGYSLVRSIFNVGVDIDQDAQRKILNANHPGLEATLGEALLVPHRSYLNDLRSLGVGGGTLNSQLSTLNSVKGIAHITGGGIPGNLPRILPEGLGARIERSAWNVPSLFRLIQQRGDIDEEEMYRAFNMGIGLILAVAAEDVDAVRAQLAEAIVVGEVISGKGVQWVT